MKSTISIALLPLLAFTLPAAGRDDDEKKNPYDHPFETEALREPELNTDGGALIRNVTVHSAVEPAFVADVLVVDGDIAAIGDGLAAPPDATVIDGTGKHLAPGVIDTHSHMGIEQGINEGSLTITADCDITDSINADDKSLYRALAGGVTTIQCLHGSANAIGGRSEVIKLKYGEDVEAMRFPDAPQGIKFALGENPKRGGGGGRRGGARRYPGTRPGVESVFHRAFHRAQEYSAELSRYEDARRKGEDPAPPRRDVRLDVLKSIIDGTVLVHSHCYRADEILMLLRVAEEYGFRVQTLQHVLEGYQVAAEIAEHGAGTSTFSDWWAYKIEAYDAIPHNAALMDEAGAVSTINSDSGEMVRRLYHEAAKSVRYAGMDRVRALQLCTLNGAIQLGIDDRVGSIEVGKDADLVLLNGDPLSTYSRVEWTMVDGRVEFQRRDAFGLDEEVMRPRTLERPMLIEASYSADAGDTIAITGGTLHPVTEDEIENGTLLIQNGRIVDMGTDLSIPVDARVIDATGQHVWPGMIALNTPIGLREIGSVPGTMDVSEGGGDQPDIRVTASLHADSAHIAVTRTNGVTRSQTAPQGGGPFRGQSAVIRLTGDTWEELVTVDRDMMHVRFPSVSNTSKEKKEPKALKEITKTLEEAREYDRLQNEARELGTLPPPFDPRLDALVPYAKGERKLGLHVSNAQTILYAIKWVKEQELDVVFFGVREGWKVADAIAEADIPCVVGPVLTLPGSHFDPYDSAYANAAVLHRAGVRFAIMPADSENVRNIGFHAGMAAAFGLPKGEALRAVTYYPAQILGLEKELGSLEPGKIADVVISDGDLLEPATRVSHVLIDGETQDVGNKQSRLYDYWRARMLEVQKAR